MYDRPVDTSIKILRTLSKESLSTNDLIKQTSSDKSHVESVIKSLERAKIIKRTRVRNVHRQKIINQLDFLGQQLLNLIHRIERYNNAFSEFVKSYRRKEGWTEAEKERVFDVIEACTRNICNILIHIYSAYSPKKSNSSTILQPILNDITISFLSEQFSMIQRESKNEKIDHFVTIALEDIIDHKIGLELYSSPYIGKETKNLMNSLFQLMLTPSDEKEMLLSNYLKIHYGSVIGQDKFSLLKDTLRRYDEV